MVSVWMLVVKYTAVGVSVNQLGATKNMVQELSVHFFLEHYMAQELVVGDT